MRPAYLPLTVLALVLTFTSAGGREWTDASGKNKTEAEFLELQEDGVVRLKRADERIISLPLVRLSPADRIFILKETLRLEAVIPKLGDEGTLHSSDLINAVRKVCAPHAGKSNLGRREFDQAVQRAKEVFLEHSPKIIQAEGSRSAVTPAIVVLLQDMNDVVRATGVSVMHDIGKSASAALPAAARLLMDDNEHIQQLANEVLAFFADQTDVAAPTLVELMFRPDVELVERASESLNQISAVGPRLGSVVPQLVKQVTSERRAAELRVLSAGSLHNILVRFHRNEHAGVLGSLNLHELEMLLRRSEIRDRQVIRDALAGITGVDETLAPTTCRQLLPVLDDENAAVREAAANTVASISPELLINLPDETFVKLLMESRPVEDDIGFNDENPVVGAALLLAEQGRMPVKLTPEQAVKLIGKQQRQYQMFAQTQLQMMGAKAQAALPELAKLAAHQDPQLRSVALRILSSPVFSRSGDLSQMPTLEVSVSADEQGRIKSITSQGTAIADVGKLQETLATYKLPKPAGVDIDAILKQALTDSDRNVRVVALEGLAGRNTASAKSILRETRHTAVDREMREMAAMAIARMDSRFDDFGIPGFGADEEDDPDENPFGPDEAEAAKEDDQRDLAVLLSVDPTLRLDQLAPLLDAIVAAQVNGIRLAGTDEVAGELHLQPQGDDPHGARHVEQFLELRLTQPPEQPRGEVSVQSTQTERWIRVPSFEALQFLLTFVLDRRSNDYYGNIGIYSERIIGANALPYQATINADSNVRHADLVATLKAIGGFRDEQFGSRDLLQWVVLSIDGKPGPRWYLKVAHPEAD